MKYTNDTFAFPVDFVTISLLQKLERPTSKPGEVAESCLPAGRGRTRHTRNVVYSKG